MRALVFVNRALMGRSHMEEQADNWLKEAGTLPPGNGVEKDLWEVRSLPGPPHLLSAVFQNMHALPARINSQLQRQPDGSRVPPVLPSSPDAAARKHFHLECYSQ